MKLLLYHGVEAATMNLIEKTMSFISRFRTAMSSKARLEVDDLVDNAIMDTRRANADSVRMLAMFQETINKLKAARHVR